jgi:hypothetical protein
MPKEPKWLALCCLAIVLALYVVGSLRHGVLRNMLQTLSLWVLTVLGFRGNEFAKWSAMPCNSARRFDTCACGVRGNRIAPLYPAQFFFGFSLASAAIENPRVGGLGRGAK